MRDLSPTFLSLVSAVTNRDENVNNNEIIELNKNEGNLNMHKAKLNKYYTQYYYIDG